MKVGGRTLQDNYIGDIGDYGKYGLLRIICSEKLSLSVNWYKVIPQKIGKQDDGKYINYLFEPSRYREYDAPLFDSLRKIVCEEKDRRIARIENENLFSARYCSEAIGADRISWHKNALIQTEGTNIVFLDPDNGLETPSMHNRESGTEKHVKWVELKEYYARGQSVILYQHRPQMTKKEKCIETVLYFQNEYLKADCVKLLEFPKYTNRFYFMFLHSEHQDVFAKICASMSEKWGKNEFCREIKIK